MEARYVTALEDGPWLMGDRYTAADLLLVSPWTWFPEAAPKVPVVQDWIGRCIARPSFAALQAFDADLTAPAPRQASAV